MITEERPERVSAYGSAFPDVPRPAEPPDWMRARVVHVDVS